MHIFGGDDLPRIAETDPYLLGATSSTFGGPGEYGRGDRYVARTANRVDERLAEALTGTRMVIVVGPSKAGKTRTLFEAVRALDSRARIVWPVIDGIGELAGHPRVADTDDTLVVWLDDLHEYLSGSQALTTAVLAQLTARPGRTPVVATLRSEMRAQLRGEGELRRDIRLLLEQASIIDLAATSEDPVEQNAAVRMYSGQVFGPHGLGEVLAGAPELLARYDDAKAADPVRHTVLRIVVDWARIGRPDPIPEPILTELTIRQLRVERPEIDIQRAAVDFAIGAARTAPQGAGRAAALLTSYLSEEVRGYRPFDYLVAADDGQDNRALRPIPDSFWEHATRDTGPEILFAVANTAYQRENTAEAGRLSERAAEAGHPGAMYNLGILLHAQDRLPEAEHWWRRAAEAGVLAAMVNLGELLHIRNHLPEAEHWLRRAAEAGDPAAMSNLGSLLHAQDRLPEAEHWWRRAADAGSAAAMHGLGSLLEDLGRVPEAEFWYRKAAEAGESSAMYNLGLLLSRQGRVPEAELWYRRAAEAGVSIAMYSLGVLLSAREDRLPEAELWYRKAAEAGESSAMYNLGLLLSRQGRVPEAELWYRKAADTGNPGAMHNLGILLYAQDEVREAEECWRRAAEVDYSASMTNLGNVLAERDRPEDAELWYRKAAEAGIHDAMHNLAILLRAQGRTHEAEIWDRRANE
ncbi:tetratricopeptide repeat protein [Nocardia sp. NPDC003963]